MGALGLHCALSSAAVYLRRSRCGPSSSLPSAVLSRVTIWPATNPRSGIKAGGKIRPVELPSLRKETCVFGGFEKFQQGSLESYDGSLCQCQILFYIMVKGSRVAFYLPTHPQHETPGMP